MLRRDKTSCQGGRPPACRGLRPGVRTVKDGGRKTEIREQMSEVRNLKIRKMWDIIEAFERGLLPDKIMINTHPQRWTDDYVPWVKELLWQNFKNVIKKWMVSRKDAKALR